METKAAEPIRIGTKLVKNRVTFAPTVKFDWSDGAGIAVDRFRRHYEDRAKGGAGLICVEATCVEPQGRLAPSQLGLWEDGQIPGHRAIVDACHPWGTVMLVQLHHAGSAAHPDCGPAIGPSAVERRGRTCGELTKERIREIAAAFIAAAERARAAGYDGVQLHGCHGYLINQFISPAANLRTDEYGGSIENRAPEPAADSRTKSTRPRGRTTCRSPTASAPARRSTPMGTPTTGSAGWGYRCTNTCGEGAGERGERHSHPGPGPGPHRRGPGGHGGLRPGAAGGPSLGKGGDRWGGLRPLPELPGVLLEPLHASPLSGGEAAA